MDALLVAAAERAIEYMHQNMSEPITIDDLAVAAMFSKYYFTRFFQDLTGLSPGRFLSAIRIERAKELLLATDDTVTEVSYRVGYSSLGTFSLRFRASVGLSPTAYRQQDGVVEHLPGEAGHGRNHASSAILRGRLDAPDDAPEVRDVLVGLFSSRLPHGRPVRWTFSAQPGGFVLDDVPPGRWHLIADAPRPRRPPEQVATERGDLVAAHGPIVVRRDSEVHVPDMQLRPSSPLDPPVLLARIGRRLAASPRVPAPRGGTEWSVHGNCETPSMAPVSVDHETRSARERPCVEFQENR